MKTEAACGKCPLTLLCLTNQRLIINKTRKHTYMRNKGIRNIHRVRVCRRCLCVFFEHAGQTRICSQIREGVHTGTEPGMNSVTAALLAERRGWRSGDRVVWSNGCRGGKGRKARKPHALNHHIGKDKITDDSFDDYDCFDHLETHITEIT
jgi:hypothetical protein